MSYRSAFTFLIVFAFLVSCVSPRDPGTDTARTADEFVVIGYVPGFRGEIDETTIDANKLTHINYNKDQSGDRALKEYTQAGVPSKKLVLGIPFYGRSWYMKSHDNRGINRGVDSLARGGGYTFVKDSIATRPGFVRYWDDKAKAPYLWNAETKQLVTYDDEESVKLKCAYVREHKMAGVMFWQYASDPKEYLINAIHETRASQ
ncbi:MAG: glycosyl hydrolase family 18 protein [Cyclobacteriaceae bacterium]